MNAKTDSPDLPDHGDPQARQEAERAKAALDNVREGYGRSPSLPAGGGAPDPTPHGQVPERRRDRSDSAGSD